MGERKRLLLFLGTHVYLSQHFSNEQKTLTSRIDYRDTTRVASAYQKNRVFRLSLRIKVSTPIQDFFLCLKHSSFSITYSMWEYLAIDQIITRKLRDNHLERKIWCSFIYYSDWNVNIFPLTPNVKIIRNSWLLISISFKQKPVLL